MNTDFIDHLKEYNNSPQYVELFATILKGNLKNCNNTGRKEAEKITSNITKLKMRLKNAKDMMLDGEFSAGDYKTMKIEIEEELEKIDENVNVIGVNNRNLKSMEIDIKQSVKLAAVLPSRFTKISESGIENVKTIQQLKNCGYDGFLIGSYFMKYAQPELACKEFIKEIKENSSQELTSEESCK